MDTATDSALDRKGLEGPITVDELEPVAFVDKVGNVTVTEHSQLAAMLKSLPDAPVGQPLLPLYPASAIESLQRELRRAEISRNAWEDSARINKGRADEAEARARRMEEALRKSAQGWANVIELGLLPMQHVWNAETLRDEARAALTDSPAPEPLARPSVTEGVEAVAEAINAARYDTDMWRDRVERPINLREEAEAEAAALCERAGIDVDDWDSFKADLENTLIEFAENHPPAAPIPVGVKQEGGGR